MVDGWQMGGLSGRGDETRTRDLTLLPVPDKAGPYAGLTCSNIAAGIGYSSSQTIEMGRSPSKETRSLAGPRKWNGAVSPSLRLSTRAKNRIV